MRRQQERQVSPKRKFSILEKLLDNKAAKQVAYEEDISLPAVYDVKKMFPLFFWKKVDETH